MIDRDSRLDRHQIRHLCFVPEGRTRGDHQASQTIFESNARSSGEYGDWDLLTISDLLLDLTFHQCSKDL
jgi:hypothetical protein